MKGDELLIHAGIKLSEINHSKKDEYHMISLIIKILMNKLN